MSGNFFRWPVVLVADADMITRFYENVFGWQRWYDNALDFDARFHPVAVAADRARARLIVIGEGDPEVWPENHEAPAIALMEYADDIGEARDAERTSLRRGDFVFMIRTEDVDAAFARAVENGARISSPPTDWSIAHPAGQGETHYRTTSFFDPAGTYVEVSLKRAVTSIN